MTIGEAIGIRILDLCKDRNISLNKLSTICGITQSTLNNIISGVSKNPTVSTVKKVCEGLSISLSEFFDTELFRQLEQEVR